METAMDPESVVVGAEPGEDVSIELPQRLSRAIVWSFRLIRLLLIISTFASAFAWTRPYGTAAFFIAVPTASALSGLVLLANRLNLATITCAFVTGAIGAVCGYVLLSELLLRALFLYDHGDAETEQSMFIAAVTGCVLASSVRSLACNWRRVSE